MADWNPGPSRLTLVILILIGLVLIFAAMDDDYDHSPVFEQVEHNG